MHDVRPNWLTTVSLVSLVSTILIPACTEPSAGNDDGMEVEDTGDSEETGESGETGDTGNPDPELGCALEDYEETFPDPEVDISEHLAAYDGDPSQAEYKDFLLDVVGARYPFGADLLARGDDPASTPGLTCFDAFFPQIQGFGSLLDDAELAAVAGGNIMVHECGHLADLGMDPPGYIVNENLTIACEPLVTPPSNIILDDEYAELWALCSVDETEGCDFYGELYLNGQGFEMLLEEGTQFTNSLAVGYALSDLPDNEGVDQRGATLSFMFYVERYLRAVRTQHPEAYSALVEDPCWRDAIIVYWHRASLYLARTESLPILSTVDEPKLQELVAQEELLDEIRTLYAAGDCEAFDVTSGLAD